MGELGINVDGRAAIAPASLAALGATWARCPAYPDADISPWMRDCHAAGVRVLLVLASESIGQDSNDWTERISHYANRYGSLVDAYQIGNEADHVSPSSWTMAPDDLSDLLRTAREVLGPKAYIVGAGLADGQPDWADDVDWSPVDALAFHPYAKDENTPALNEPIDMLFDGYARQGKPLWVTEYHARDIGFAAALRDDDRAQVGLAFCYTDRMVEGFGLIEDYRALEDFRTAAAGQVLSTPPTEPAKAYYQLGFKKWHDLEPGRLGSAIKNERNVAPGWQTQRTSKGTLCWVDGLGHAFIRDDGRVYRWQESWAKSEEVKA